MRYQEPIYIQSKVSAVRNKGIPNANMSSDMCVFYAPEFSIGGACKIDCTATTATTYVISTATTIPLTFGFTGNVSTFSATNATFKYEVYKYNPSLNRFTLPPVFRSNDFSYPSFSGTNSFIDTIPVTNLTLDGEYLVKGYYKFNACTEYLNKLGKTVDTSIYKGGTEYNLYDPNLDFYFIAFKAADKPVFANSGSNSIPSGLLLQQPFILSDGQTSFVIANNFNGTPIITLNGLVLAIGLDYTLSGNVVTLVAPAVNGDIATSIYTTNTSSSLKGENFTINKMILSGTTNNQGNEKAYFNTTTQKYEIYLDTAPSSSSNIMLMLNGATLTNGVDFYPSSSNTKRLILEGDLVVGDIITLVYFPSLSVTGEIRVSSPIVNWTITNPPQLVNGVFTLEVSLDNSFTSIYSSLTQNYVVGQIGYTDSFSLSGPIGQKLYYRVKNQKTFVSLCGFSATSITYSDIIPIVIATNSINSY